jgi:HK97 family phage portal protein
VLTENAEVKPLSISPVDVQLIAMRGWEKQDICEAFGVPPIIIGSSEKTSSWGTGIEQVILGFVRFSVKPMLIRIEQELNRKLFRRAGQFVEFELEGLLRGDSKSMGEADRSALGGPGSGDGYMTINEVRRRRNLPPIPGGNQIYRAATSPAAAPAPAPAAPTPAPAPTEPTQDTEETDDEASA